MKNKLPSSLTPNTIPSPQLHHPGQGKTLVSVTIQRNTRHSQAETEPLHQSVLRTIGFLLVDIRLQTICI